VLDHTLTEEALAKAVNDLTTSAQLVAAQSELERLVAAAMQKLIGTVDFIASDSTFWNSSESLLPSEEC